jgi:hypothetical protein
MTGRASPGKCATRTGPAFRSSRDFDTYTTFDMVASRLGSVGCGVRISVTLFH